jgi:methylaspartate mutase epsilon subunit
MQYKYRMLIGGIGDDAHSIAISLLTLGFREAGFHVFNLGIRNTLADFFKFAPHFDIIMISNKNGHCELYLEDFPAQLSHYRLTDDSPKLWYLGGSLSVSESDFSVKKKYLNWGFTNVYPKPVSFQVVYNDVLEDVHRYNIPRKEVVNLEAYHTRKPIDYGSVLNHKMQREELQAQRNTVLAEWKTGRGVAEHDQDPRLRDTLKMDTVLQAHNPAHGPLLQPRTGVADIKKQISLLQYLEQSGSDISSVQLDAASRSKLYERAEHAVQLSLERGHSILNGFPVPVYGVEKVKELVLSLKRPFQLRGGGPDHRLTYEISLKGGASGVEGGAVCYLMPYDKLTSPQDSIRYWQYVDRLCALYEEEHGYFINREYFGVLTASLIEPSIAICVNIVQAMLSAQQGVKSISVGYAEQGNRHQDIAAMTVMKEMVLYYLHAFGYRNCRVTTVFHQYMAAFPGDTAKAEDLIRNSSITATLAGATRMMVKTAAEAIKIPDQFDNARALGLCRQGIIESSLRSVNATQVRVEKKMLKLEVTQMMHAIIELGNRQIATGLLKAIEQGIIDVPWSPNIYNRNQVTAIRDVSGAIRFTDFGNLPFTSQVKDFHEEKVFIRKTAERKYDTFSLLEEDLSRIWKCDYKAWPLDDHYIDVSPAVKNDKISAADI